MSQSYNYLTLNNPNGPNCSVSSTVAVAEWVDVPIDGSVDLDSSVATLKVKDMHLPNFWVRKSEGVFRQDALFNNVSDIGLNLLGSCFFHKGHVKSWLKNEVVGEAVSGTHNFKFDPQNEYRHRLTANVPFDILHFSVSPHHLLGFFPEGEGWAERLKTGFINNQRMIGDRYVSITLAQERIIQNIIDCPLTGKFGVLMIETSIVQLILLQLHSLYQRHDSRQAAISKKDIEVVNGVKDYLTKNFLEDHSLQCLAKHFGTNTNKLMTLFKKTFGKSVFEYISELKMELAHQLLQEEGKRVAEVARVTGYKNPNHFSTAFKKQFGVSPSQLRPF